MEFGPDRAYSLFVLVQHLYEGTRGKELQKGLIIRTCRDRLFSEIFPVRSNLHVSKTLIFAKDDSHAGDIVRIVREEIGKVDVFSHKIIYRAA